ncbi:MAG: hypothetical protein FWF56_02415 [Firmicutes bacterium]|nr:hypothetical protein [Bacillota bacterium]MCL1953817.1 hypothetical protein [Bacillota bacterium]
MLKYYRILAKCGHVGRNYYYEGEFFVSASNPSIAAQIVKSFPRVKRNHKDVILNIQIITQEECKLGQQAQARNPYFNCVSQQQQSLYWDDIAPFIKPETEMQKAYREYKFDSNLQYNNKSMEIKVKKPYKRDKFSLNVYLKQVDYMF